MTDRWAIYDANGKIYSGDEDLMRSFWGNRDQIRKDNDVKGDLELVEIHAVSH